MFERLKSFVKALSLTEKLLAVFLLVFLGISLSAVLRQFLSFNSVHPRDMATVVQPAFQTLFASKFMFCNLQGMTQFLQTHFSIMFFLFIPIILLLPYIEVLFIIQTAWFVVGAVFIYLIAKHLLKRELIPALIAVAYCLYAPSQHLILNDLRCIHFFPAFILITFYLYLKRRPRSFMIFFILTLLTRDEGFVAVAFFPLLEIVNLFLSRKAPALALPEAPPDLRRYALFPAIAIAVYFILFTVGLKDLLRHVTGVDQSFLFSMGKYGDTAVKAVSYAALHPIQIFQDIILVGAKWKFFMKDIFLPLLLIPLAGFQGLILLLPPGMLYFMFDYPGQASISSPYMINTAGIRYLSTLLPYFFISFIFGIRNIGLLFKNARTYAWLAGAALLVICILNLRQSTLPLPFSQKYDASRFTTTDRNRAIAKMLHRVKRNGSISTQFDYLAYFANRNYLSDINLAYQEDYAPVPLGDYLFVDLKKRWYFNLDQFFYTMWQARSAPDKYVIVDAYDGAFLLAKESLRQQPFPSITADQLWNYIFNGDFPVRFSERYADIRPTDTIPAGRPIASYKDELFVYPPVQTRVDGRIVLSLPIAYTNLHFRKHALTPLTNGYFPDSLILNVYLRSAAGDSAIALKPVQPLRFWRENRISLNDIVLDGKVLTRGQTYSVYLDFSYDEQTSKRIPDAPFFLATVRAP